MKRYGLKLLSLFFSLLCLVVSVFDCALPASGASTPAGQSVAVNASGQYVNWDGVTNVAQFKGADGSLWYAVDSETAVTVYKTKNGAPVSGSVTLKKTHPLFGTVVCDSDGNFYLITGEANDTDNTDVDTVFISKFDKNGKHVKTVGDNGSSSLAYFYDDSFYTKVPFYAGNCDAAVSGKTLTVIYARSMYSGHQSCSVFSVNTDDLSKMSVGVFYESHSFAQRVVPTKEGFVYVSEGDCYDRAFAVYSVKLSDGRTTYGQSANVFDFWVEDGALDAYNMYVVNNNFAHMGGLATLPNGNIAFAATSAASLNSDAEKETEQIFLQIFDPYGALDTPSAFVTKGERTGLAGNNGRTPVTNYGVQWLTAYGEDARVRNVQISATDHGEIVVLYELIRDYKYAGVWYMILDDRGNVIRPAAQFAANAMLNPCETPIYADGAVYWVGNEYRDSDGRLRIYRLPVSEEDCSFTGNHVWDAGRITKKATCTAAGEKTFTCTVCSSQKTEPTAKTAHSLVRTASKAATCTAAGNVEYFTCSVCKKTFSDAKGTKEITDVTVKAAGHKLTKTAAKAATCTAAGNVEYYTCSVCKKTFSDAKGTKEITDVTVKAAGHKLTKTAAKAATCTAAGNVEYYVCSVCKKTFSDAKGTQEITDVTVKAAGHKLTKTAAKAATCTAAGNVEYYTCSVCKKTFSDAKGTKEITDVTVKAAGHSFGAWIVTKEATTDSEGIETRKCSKCGEEENHPIEKLEVTYLPGDVSGDGKVTAEDARLALRAAVGLDDTAEGLDFSNPQNRCFLAADVDGEAGVTASDARLILRAAVGLETLA